jgi:hypothetical protein
MGSVYKIPYFDPWDGGTAAEVLYLLEAPGGYKLFQAAKRLPEWSPPLTCKREALSFGGFTTLRLSKRN